MRVLLDHCVPKRLGRLLIGHEVRTARAMGWDDIGNGRLLALAVGEFDVMVTVDRNLAYQQNREALPLPVVILRASDNTTEVLAVLVPEVLSLLASGPTRCVHFIPSDLPPAGT